MNAAAVSIQPLPKEDNTLAGLVERLEARDSESLPDRTVPLAKVRMTTDGTLTIPGAYGSHVLTDWARGQLSKAVGLSWDRYFSNASANDISEEMNKRLSRATQDVKLRSVSRVAHGLESTGTITAFVSPTYSPIPDAVVGTVLRDSLAGIEEDTKILRYNATELTTSYVVRVGQKLTPSAEVGAVEGCLHVRNSGTGFARCVVQLLLLRKVCSNGLLIALPGSVLVSAIHRGVDLDRVRERLVAGLRDVPSLVVRASNMMAQATHVEVSDVELEVGDVLREARLPLGLVAPVMSAYLREASSTRFWVSQAITLAAQSQSPEVGYDLERAAGLYLAQA